MAAGEVEVFFHMSLAHNGQCETVRWDTCSCGSDLPVCSFTENIQGDTLVLYLRQPDRNLGPRVRHEEGIGNGSLLRRKTNDASTTILSPDTIGTQMQASIHPFAIVPCSLESHSAGNASYKIPTLGEKGEHDLTLVHVTAEIPSHGTQCHVVNIVALLCGAIVDRENTAVKLVIVAVILFLCHFAQKPII